MWYNPLVIKWSCMIASKCHRTGYTVVWSILPIPTRETIEQYRQATSTTCPISQQNLALVVQEMVRRGCIGGRRYSLGWNEYKRTAELVLDDKKPLNSWLLGQILEVYANSRYGLVLSVKLKTSTSQLVRLINKILLLEAIYVPSNSN